MARRERSRCQASQPSHPAAARTSQTRGTLGPRLPRRERDREDRWRHEYLRQAGVVGERDGVRGDSAVDGEEREAGRTAGTDCNNDIARTHRWLKSAADKL